MRPLNCCCASLLFGPRRRRRKCVWGPNYFQRNSPFPHATASPADFCLKKGQERRERLGYYFLEVKKIGWPTLGPTPKQVLSSDGSELASHVFLFLSRVLEVATRAGGSVWSLVLDWQGQYWPPFWLSFFVSWASFWTGPRFRWLCRCGSQAP